MGKQRQTSIVSGGVYLLLVTSMMMLLLLITGCSFPSREPTPVPPTATEIYTATPSIDHGATATAYEIKAFEEQKAQTAAAELKMTEDSIASATAEEEAAIAERATSEAEAAATEQARQDATATELAKATNTPTNTPIPLRTNTPPPPPTTDMIVRGPGEKAAGDHPILIKNKTGANATIIMYGDKFNYTFYVPDGNHKIYLRPGYYSYTLLLCGGRSSGSHQFNANWTWELKCN